MQNQQHPDTQGNRPTSPPLPRIRPRRHQILVECRDEQDQRAFHARMVAERRKCRVLTLG